jgi:hypothetical protein
VSLDAISPMTTVLRYVAIVLAACLTYCAPALAQRIERPVFHVGDTWTYRRVDEPLTFQSFREYSVTQVKTITKISPDEFELAVESISESGEKTFSTEQSSLDFNDYVKLSSDQPRQEIRTWKWPVDVGDTWKYEYPVKAGAQVWEARVVGWEEVEVPAGRFRALKVEREMLSDPGGGKARTAIVWFSPEAKVIVKRVDRANSRNYQYINSERVLMSYKVN